MHIMKIYYTNSSYFRAFFPTTINLLSIHRTVQKFEETGSVCYATRTYQRSAGSFENIADVRDSVQGNPNLSIPRRS